MRTMLAVLLGGAVTLVGMLASLAPADARRGGGIHRGGNHVHVARHASRSVNVNRRVTHTRNVNRTVTRNVNRKYVYRNGQRGYWRNGVWVVAPAVAGATYVASCAYEYGRWQNTGSAYWRDRYYQCAN